MLKQLKYTREYLIFPEAMQLLTYMLDSRVTLHSMVLPGARRHVCASVCYDY